jgi:hypothetical protein
LVWWAHSRLDPLNIVCSNASFTVQQLECAAAISTQHLSAVMAGNSVAQRQAQAPSRLNSCPPVRCQHPLVCACKGGVLLGGEVQAAHVSLLHTAAAAAAAIQ